MQQSCVQSNNKLFWLHGDGRALENTLSRTNTINYYVVKTLSVVFVPLMFVFVWRVRGTFSPSGWCFSTFVTTGWIIFDISLLCENSTNQNNSQRNTALLVTDETRYIYYDNQRTVATVVIYNPLTRFSLRRLRLRFSPLPSCSRSPRWDRCSRLLVRKKKCRCR